MWARKLRDNRQSHGTSGNGKTAQSYIAGIGASGALLAGAVVTFVFLVGAVSFEVWPSAAGQSAVDDTLGVAELSGPASGSGSDAPATTLGEAVTLLAAAVPAVDAAPKVNGGLSGGGGGGGGGDEGQGDSTSPGTGGGSGTGSDGGIADTPDDPDPGQPTGGGSDRPSSGGGGGNRPSRGESGASTPTAPGTGTSGSSGSSGGGSSGGSGSSGSNHSNR